MVESKQPNIKGRTSKVYRGKIAPQSWLFFIVEVTIGKTQYSNSVKINFKGGTEEDKVEILESLVTVLRAELKKRSVI